MGASESPRWAGRGGARARAAGTRAARARGTGGVARAARPRVAARRLARSRACPRGTPAQVSAPAPSAPCAAASRGAGVPGTGPGPRPLLLLPSRGLRGAAAGGAGTVRGPGGSVAEMELPGSGRGRFPPFWTRRVGVKGMLVGEVLGGGVSPLPATPPGPPRAPFGRVTGGSAGPARGGAGRRGPGGRGSGARGARGGDALALVGAPPALGGRGHVACAPPGEPLSRQVFPRSRESGR